MVLKLYGYTQSPPAKLVAAILHEKGVPFEYINIDLLKGEHKAPEFLAKQPFGKVPVIDDDGFILYESHAIARYIEEKYFNQGTKLIPTDPRKRALFEQAVCTAAFSFDHYVTPILWETRYKKFFGGETDWNRVEESKKQLAAKLDVYEQILSKQKYIAGDELTLADFYHLPGGTQLQHPEVPVNLIEERPNVARWLNEISSRESWQRLKDGLSTA